MIIAIVSALVLAWLAPAFAVSLKLGGEVFLRLLMMVVVPLVMASVMSGILGLGDVRKLGKPGAVAIGYYLTTTILAVATGVLIVNMFSPGVGLDADSMMNEMGTTEHHEKLETLEQSEEGPKNIGDIFHKMVLMLFTSNLLKSMVEGELLPLIVFSIAFAGLLTTMGSRSETMRTLIVSINDAMMGFVMLLMKFAPIGIFCLVTSSFGEFFLEGDAWEKISSLGWYMATVLVGLGIHAFITLPLILWVFTKRNPIKFYRQMSDALLTAFSTASSSATLPVTMECAEVNAGVSRRSVEFVLPLGATVNMDGTALYEAAAAIFMAQIYAGANPEFTFGFTEQIIVAVTATLAAIGAAGIPEAGLVTMLIVLNAVGLPTTYLPLILPVDWLLDRFRTATNAFGDSVGSAVVDQSFPDAEAA
ncbi:MAG: dicarboxylate/amino acid:cation symporter [Fuerstiella sp.]|nr:dicarboxylate/amino acid:cation symporter [Fuerstiella sp.]MCP4858575.1 dicarboxylate/amino acid:cation symporter [Fuerstiella sp.]